VAYSCADKWDFPFKGLCPRLSLSPFKKIPPLNSFPNKVRAFPRGFFGPSFGDFFYPKIFHSPIPKFFVDSLRFSRGLKKFGPNFPGAISSQNTQAHSPPKEGKFPPGFTPGGFGPPRKGRLNFSPPKIWEDLGISHSGFPLKEPL